MTDEEKIVMIDCYCTAMKAHIWAQHNLNRLYKKSRASVSDSDIKSARDKEAWEYGKAYGIEIICRLFNIKVPTYNDLCEQVKSEHKIKNLYVN